MKQHVREMHQLVVGLRSSPTSFGHPRWRSLAAQDSGELAKVLTGHVVQEDDAKPEKQYRVHYCVNCDAKFVRPFGTMREWPHLATSFCGLNCMWSSHFRQADAKKIAWIQQWRWGR